MSEAKQFAFMAIRQEQLSSHVNCAYNSSAKA
jgi:hypothetical protein